MNGNKSGNVFYNAREIPNNNTNSCNTSQEKRKLRLAVAKMYDALNMLFSLDNTTIERELFNEYQIYGRTLTKRHALVFKAPQLIQKFVPLEFVLKVAHLVSRKVRDNEMSRVIVRHRGELGRFFSGRNDVYLKGFILDFICHALPQEHAEKLMADIKFHIRNFIKVLALPRIGNHIFRERKRS